MRSWQRLSLIISCVVGLLLLATAVFYLSSLGVYRRHFSQPLPPTAKLVNWTTQYAGPDRSYAFVFEVEDEELYKQLIQEWDLRRARPNSFIALHPPPWWNSEIIRAADRSMGRTDHDLERYWSIWMNSEAGLMYVEYGKW